MLCQINIELPYKTPQCRYIYLQLKNTCVTCPIQRTITRTTMLYCYRYVKLNQEICLTNNENIYVCILYSLKQKRVRAHLILNHNNSINYAQYKYFSLIAFTMYTIFISILKSFLEKDCVISAQYPLPDYSEDLLRLVWDFNARIVVFLCPIKELASVRTFIHTCIHFHNR